MHRAARSPATETVNPDESQPPISVSAATAAVFATLIQAHHDPAERAIDDLVAKTHFGFAKGPVLLAQQIADGSKSVL
jgi:hypothetical protein